MSEGIQVRHRGRVATLTIDRPPLNILGLAALEALREALGELSSEEELQLLVVRGGGDKAFSAGVAVQDHTPDKVASMLESFHGALRLLLDLPVPSLAVVRGHCLGGGMELAAACDLRFARAGSRFGQPEIELGCYPPWAAADYPALLGTAATTEMLLTGRVVDAEEARRLGFVQRVAEEEALAEQVDAFVAAVTGKSAAVTRLAMRAIRARRGRGFDAALAESERLYLEELAATDDMTEGLAAFLEKRPPEWKHR